MSIKIAIHKSKGAATLFVTLIILLLTLLVGLYTGKGMITEIKISADDARTKIAHNHAEAGLQSVLDALESTSPIFDETQPINRLPATTGTDIEGDVVIYAARMCNGSVTQNNLPACPATPAGIACTAADTANSQVNWIVSCGWSTDRSANKRIVTQVRGIPPVANPPSNPVVTRGAVNVGGNATVVNYYNNLTYWSAAGLSSNSATGKTAIRNPSPLAPALQPQGTGTLGDSIAAAVGNGNQLCANTNPTRPIVCTTTSSSTGIGADVVAGDTSLGNLTRSQFFQNFMGQTPENYKDMITQRSTEQNPTLLEYNEIDGNSLLNSNIYWINVPTGQTLTLNNQTPIGQNGQPAIVIIDGDVNFSASTAIFGIVYVRGNASGAGSPTIRGSMIVEGQLNTTGALTVIFDPSNLDFGNNNFQSFSMIPGTWRDF